MNKVYIMFVVVPAFAAVLCPFIARLKPRLADVLCILTMLVGLLAAISYIPAHQNLLCLVGKTSSPFGADALRGDAFSLLMLITIYLVAFCVTGFSSFYIKDTARRGDYFALIALAVAAMSGVVSARDFFTIYIFIEVLAVCSFALIAFNNKAENSEGALKYFFISAPASMLLVLSIALLMLYSGGTSFTHLAQSLGPAASIILGLMACGFMIKSGLAPFHFWTPDVYQSAPTPIAALLAGVITKVAGVYTLVRISMLLRVFYPEIGMNVVGQALMFFGALSIIVGALGAMQQRDFKRLLAYSSISQVGYIILAAGMGTPLAVAGAIFHLFNHATFKTSLFFNSAALERSAGTTDIRKMGGLESRMPWTSWTAVVAMLSTAGIPPLSGFWSKLIIIIALWKGGAHSYASIALLASVLTLAYFLMVQRKVFFGKTPDHMANVQEASPAFLWPAVLLAAIMIIIGLYFPIIFSNLIEPSSRAFL